MTRTLLALLVLLVGAGVRPGAHHPDADVYVRGAETTVEGQVTQVIYRNPHSFLVLTTESGSLPRERWVIELLGASRLKRHGIAVDTLKVGQHVIVKGSPGRIPADRRLRLHTIVRPNDGWRWTVAAF